MGSTLALQRMLLSTLLLSLALLSLSACATQPVRAPQATPATPDVQPPPTTVSPEEAQTLWSRASQVIEQRCVVCHGCFDAPCQLKLGSSAGIVRGANATPVYDPARLTAAQPTRLDIDAQNTAQWRELGFHPVLPEGAQRDAEASVLMRVLKLKREHPMPNELDRVFTFALDREQTCVKADDFDAFAQDHPFWGMPYALPALSDQEHAHIADWLAAGAPQAQVAALSPALVQTIEQWEQFLNATDRKSQLMARYLYEHLFLSSLIFDEADSDSANNTDNAAPRVFRIVRSHSDSGEPIREIATRRPFDDPGTERFFYRFAPHAEPRLAKTFMPYALNARRMALYRTLFIEPDYTITALPSYAPDVASNPLLAFVTIPVRSRYRFLLDEAQHTLMGFIKGPVCRGQVALNVIQERFWVTFVDPESTWTAESSALLADMAPDLELPAEAGSETLALKWYQLAKQHDVYVQRKNKLLKRVAQEEPGITTALIWDGDGDNRNAALTVMRHNDSASVVLGLVGGEPMTTWLIDYPMLERIHYLLVAGFDVFGNVGHQIATRMYMDFLRMEGEHNFLVLLPIKRRAQLVERWYRGLSTEAKSSVDYSLATFTEQPAIRYRSKQPEHELYELLRTRLAAVTDHSLDLERVDDVEVRDAMQRLTQLPGPSATWWPETSFVSVVQHDGAALHFTVLRDSAHTNIAELFREDDRRLPAEDRLTVLRGFVGAYPNALFKVRADALKAFVDGAALVGSAEAAEHFHRHFGVLRTSPQFWQHSDELHAAYRHLMPHEAGLFDYSRLLGR